MDYSGMARKLRDEIAGFSEELPRGLYYYSIRIINKILKSFHPDK